MSGEPRVLELCAQVSRGKALKPQVLKKQDEALIQT